jgi:hypothetical protein
LIATLTVTGLLKHQWERAGCLFREERREIKDRRREGVGR